MEQVVLPVRVMRLMGVKVLIVTNAAGGLNDSYNVGDIMIIQDHFGTPPIAGNHPLRGENDEQLGPRFPSMSEAYDPELQNMVMNAAASLGLSDRVRPNGTYCFASGPAYETRAECRFLRSIGGDSVGMSTVPEVIAAKHCGMRILGLSLVTNKVILENKKDTVAASHAEVLAAVEQSGKHVEAIVKVIISKDVLGAYLETLPAVSYNISSSCCESAKECSDSSKCCGGNCQCGAGCKCGPGCCGASSNNKCCGGNCQCGAGCKCGPSCCGGGKCGKSSSCCPFSGKCCAFSSCKCCQSPCCWVAGAAVVALVAFVVVRKLHHN